MKRLLNPIISVMTAASIAVSPYHAALAAEPATEGLEDIEARIEQLHRSADRLRNGLKRERFDPEARVDSADFDLDNLVAFVRDEIVFQPYAGTLRGAAGTLRASAGNSLDQSLLLAQMLKSAGYDARIVRTDLTEDQALSLLSAVGNPPPPSDLDYLDAAIEEAFGTSGGEPSESRPITETSYHADALRYAGALLETLEGAGLAPTPRDVTARLLETVRSYFWVEQRDGPSADWQPAHPAFGSIEPPAELAPAETFSESIPEHYQHRFAMTAWVEQWLNGAIEKHQIMAPWTAPVANLAGVPIRFQNVPNGVSRDNTDDLDAVLAATQVFTPFVGESAAKGAMAFDLQGRSIDPMAQGGSPAAGIIKTVGDKFVDAASDMADREDGKPVMALHSMYLEFTFERPGGESETRRRYVLPPRDRYDEDPRDVLRELLTGYTYLVSAGGQPMEYIADRYIEGAFTDLDWIKFVVLQRAAPDREQVLPDELPSAFPTLYQLWTMDRLPVSEAVVRYAGQPTMVGIRDGIRDARTAFSEVDVVWNPVESIRRQGERWMTAPWDSLTKGVWDTVLESVPLAVPREGQEKALSAPVVFDRAQSQGIGLAVLEPGEPAGPAWEALGLGDQERQFVRRDLEAGYAVVIPERTPDETPVIGWWRVRPDSGETLGMLGDGYGATATEYIALTTLVAVGLTAALKAGAQYAECGGGGLAEELCCAWEKHLNLVNEEADAGKAVEESSENIHEAVCGD